MNEAPPKDDLGEVYADRPWLRIECPTCGSNPGQACMSLGDVRPASTHAARLRHVRVKPLKRT